MRKSFVAALVLMSFLLLSEAYGEHYWSSYCLTEDWTVWTEDWPNPRRIYNMAYNEISAATTGHLYLNDGENIRIANRDTGALIKTGDGFPTPSSYDRLTSYSLAEGEELSWIYYSICVADDGAIYATALPYSSVNLNEVLFRWANETATPTSQTVAGMLFTRQLEAKYAGVNTMILATGDSDNGPVQILTTADGVNFSVAHTIPYAGKTAIAIKDANTVFGSGVWNTKPSNDPISGGFPMRFDKVGGVWQRAYPTFYAPDPIDGNYSYDLDLAWLEVDPYDPRYPGNGLLLAIKYYPWPDEIWLLNDQSGSGVGKTDLQTLGIPQEGATYYGSAAADSTKRMVYWAVRSQSNTSRGYYGRLRCYARVGGGYWALY